MVSEHREGSGAGPGGETQTLWDGERERRSGRVESWSAVVPLDQTMMGLYYQAMLPVSWPLVFVFFKANNWCGEQSRVDRSR